MLSKLTWQAALLIAVIIGGAVALYYVHLPDEAKALAGAAIALVALFTQANKPPPSDGGDAGGALKSGALMILILATMIRTLAACSPVNQAADVTTTQK